jgi:hypothetical protein
VGFVFSALELRRVANTALALLALLQDAGRMPEWRKANTRNAEGQEHPSELHKRNPPRIASSAICSMTIFIKQKG